MPRKSFLLTFAVLLAFMLLILPGCGEDVTPPINGENGNNEENDINGENDNDLPQEIARWIEDSKKIFAGQSRELDGTQYILMTYGEKPTGGYVVEITDYQVGEEYVEVTVHFTEPGEDDVVTQAITYPYDLLEIEATGLPVEFVPEGDEEFIPQIFGVDYLKPVVAGSRWILMFAPSLGSTVDRQFQAEGVGNVFEGHIEYRLTDEDGTELDAGFTTAEMGNWRYFDIDITIPEDSGDELVLEIFTTSAKDGSVENLIEIELERGL